MLVVSSMKSLAYVHESFKNVYSNIRSEPNLSRMAVYRSLLTNPQRQRYPFPLLPYLPETKKNTHK